MEFLERLLNVELGLPARFIVAFIVVLLLIALTAWIIRRVASGRGRIGSVRTRQQRLAIVDAAHVDQKRRLILVRRDNVEHLILIGGPSDVVVEAQIGSPAVHEQPDQPRAAARASEAPAVARPAEPPHSATPPVPPRPARPVPPPSPPPVSPVARPMPQPQAAPRSAPVPPPRTEPSIRPPGAPPGPEPRTEPSIRPPDAPPGPEPRAVSAPPQSVPPPTAPRVSPPPPPPPSTSPPPSTPEETKSDTRSDPQLEEMAQRLEAALKRPFAASQGGAAPTPAQPVQPSQAPRLDPQPRPTPPVDLAAAMAAQRDVEEPTRDDDGDAEDDESAPSTRPADLYDDDEKRNG